MKKHISFLFILFFALEFISQNTFENGYIIDDSNQHVYCLIKSFDWINNPKKIDYKLSENEEVKSADVRSIKEFGILNNSKYIKAKVNIDRSSDKIKNLSSTRSPEFKEEVLFLKVLFEGTSNLYEYSDESLTRFFFKMAESNILQLVHKTYKTNDNQIAYNVQFKQQLLNNMKCAELRQSNFEKLTYQKKNLIGIFEKFTKCRNDKVLYSEPKQKRKTFNFSFRPRINLSSLTIRNIAFSEEDVLDYDDQLGFGIGTELELPLPIHKNKWSVFIEPTFQSFKSEKTIEDVSVILGGQLITFIDYKSLELPIGLRHYFLINKDSKVFIDAALVFDLPVGSEFLFQQSAQNYSSVRFLNSSESFAIGFGYKHQNKFSLQIRNQMNRELLLSKTPYDGNYYWNSDFNTLSIIFGYSF